MKVHYVTVEMVIELDDEVSVFDNIVNMIDSPDVTYGEIVRVETKEIEK